MKLMISCVYDVGMELSLCHVPDKIQKWMLWFKRRQFVLPFPIAGSSAVSHIFML